MATRAIIGGLNKTSTLAVLLRQQVRKFHSSGQCYLFSNEILGVEDFRRIKASVDTKLGNLRDKFFEKMVTYLKESDRGLIYTDDLKTVLHVAKSDAEIDIARQMIYRYNGQNQKIRFSSFCFGPVVMRMLHELKQADIAYMLFCDPNLRGFFDQLSTGVILMDLLFESGQYEKVLDVMDRMTNTQVNGLQYPVDCLILALAACYKLNTPAALQKVKQLFAGCEEVRGQGKISLRCLLYGAKCAINQKDPQAALEIIKKAVIMRNEPAICNNLKALIYLQLGKLADAVDQLNAVLEVDLPRHLIKGNEIFSDVLVPVTEGVNTSQDKELLDKLKRVTDGLRKGGHISESTVDAYLSRPILRIRQQSDGHKQQRNSMRFNRDNIRPGLAQSEEQFTL